ncbi:VOC family protein [Streptomyces sp. NPDC002055]|uniref:VOC family protein n=1 Tax=Streptomyces sp. NPDC002055 TaxID=3154534 RepID=UPI003324316F
MFRGIRTVMVFVDDPEGAARWWAELLKTEPHFDINGTSIYAWLDIEGIELGFHPASPKSNPHGRSTVPYWVVDDVHQVRERLLDAGCTHHRGPLRVETGRQICQLVDPFGTVFGLDGP